MGLHLINMMKLKKKAQERDDNSDKDGNYSDSNDEVMRVKWR
jgi:hypothetical protein